MNGKNNDEILVTVYCLAYNHGPYIRSALEGFVNQKTNFKYQVIVHDDASKDDTATIIKEYEEKYPEIIKGIYQSENQYSKGVPLLATYIMPFIKGKYVATCEGDDYWIDNSKLQKQFDIMEADQKLSACVHNTIFINLRDNTKYIEFSTNFEGVLPIDDIISAGGSCFHTSSVFMRREFLITPQKLSIKHIGDYCRAVYLAMNGGIYYLKDAMSVYRMFVPGSWSESDKSASKQDRIDLYESIIKMLQNADEYSDFSHHDGFEKAIRRYQFSVLCLKDNCKDAVHEYTDIIRSMPFKSKMQVYLKAYCPVAFKIIKRVFSGSRGS